MKLMCVNLHLSISIVLSRKCQNPKGFQKGYQIDNSKNWNDIHLLMYISRVTKMGVEPRASSYQSARDNKNKCYIVTMAVKPDQVMHKNRYVKTSKPHSITHENQNYNKRKFHIIMQVHFYENQVPMSLFKPPIKTERPCMRSGNDTFRGRPRCNNVTIFFSLMYSVQPQIFPFPRECYRSRGNTSFVPMEIMQKSIVFRFPWKY